MSSFDISTILNALQEYQRREARQPNNRAVKQHLLNKGVPERIAWSNSFNELCYWTEKELDELFIDLSLPSDTPFNKLISFRIQPNDGNRPSTLADFVKPNLEDIGDSASKLGALCVDRHGRFRLNPEEGFAALSHVWSQGLGADDDNRGLHKSLLTQVFDKVEPLGIKWIWTDSLAIPGGKRALDFLEEELKGKLINAMANIYRQAKYVVIFDALCLRLNSTDPVKVAAVIALGVWMTRMWCYQEIKLSTNAIVATQAGFVSFSTITETLRNLARNEVGETFNTKGVGRYPSLFRTFRRLQRDDSLGVSLADLAFGCGYREAWDHLDYARALFPTLGIEWKTGHTLSEAMRIVYNSQPHQATRLALHHGPPRASLPGWAPATFNGLIDGEIIEPGTWESRGMRRAWMTTKIKSIIPSKPGTFVLALESDFADQAHTVGFISEQTQKESPESIETFKKAVQEGNAYLLADEPLVPKRHFSRVALLVERFTKPKDLQAWVCLTLAVGETEETYKREKTTWLLLDENPVSKDLFSGRNMTELTVDINNSTIINSTTDFSQYPLHEAVQQADTEQISLLLPLIDPNSTDTHGWTPLHIAAALNHTSLFPTLLNAGASIDAFSHNDYTPLILAIENLHLEAVLALHQHGANLNLSRCGSGLGLSPLSTAALKGSVEITNLLLALGANPSAVDQGGWYPLHFAIQGAENATTTKDGEGVLDALLDAGVDVNIASQSLLYPLDIAAKNGYDDVVRKLLANGADPNRCTSALDPPLYSAIEARSVDSVRALAEAGARVDRKAKNGWTALMCAAKTGEYEVGKVLVEFGAGVDEVGAEGLTALHVAAESGSRVFYKWLVDLEADGMVRDGRGRRASEIKEGF